MLENPQCLLLKVLFLSPCPSRAANFLYMQQNWKFCRIDSSRLITSIMSRRFSPAILLLLISLPLSLSRPTSDCKTALQTRMERRWDLDVWTIILLVLEKGSSKLEKLSTGPRCYESVIFNFGVFRLFIQKSPQLQRRRSTGIQGSWRWKSRNCVDLHSISFYYAPYIYTGSRLSLINCLHSTNCCFQN